ncbi:hypothetical protein CWE08_03070 [Aliidiomarina iranensis]|uniref:Endonuclease/exonuclease/phosphatase domain-containing protein n=1 Tax=Aliidiomarina iranensis TaxID=1434071 RepID=A0A432W3A5_9GAMM|nr:ExeM/NucH family extracellular endonuclease [Aliidiomarina iranensis]RUO23643.1 hypothetical protein CWE08_03070 [Aliidiomarina iranensis]
MKVFIKALFTAALLLLATTVQANDREVLGYWSFNQGEFTENSFPLTPDVGNRAMFTLVNIGDYADGIADFTGTTTNRLDSSFPAGRDLAIRGGTDTANNGASFELMIDMTGLVDLEVSWAQRGSSTGFVERVVAYSLDGETFTTVETDSGALSSSYQARSYDLSAISELNDQANVFVRVTLTGATSTSGNNRFDNVQVTALSAADADRITVYNKDFSSNPFEMGWSEVAVSGEQRWDWNGSFGNISFSPFVSGCQANDNWLISPAINLDSQIDERLNFDIARGFPGDNPLEVYYTTVPQNGDAVNPEDWVLLTTVNSSDFSSNNAPERFAGFEELQALEGVAHIAFRFNYESGECGTWRIAQLDMSALMAPFDPVEFACGAPVTRIHQVQGFGFQSQMQGAQVQVEAVVTGVYQDTSDGGLGGFFLQEKSENADSNPLTSEGIFVYDAGFGVPLAEGDVVRVQGTVSEYFYNTQISDVTNVEICATGELDTVSAANFSLPIENFTDLESLEGMLVSSEQPLTVTEVFSAVRFGEIQVSNGRLFEPTQVAAPGEAARAVLEENARNKLIFDNARTGTYRTPFLSGIDGSEVNFENPIRNGFLVETDVTGHMGYSFGSYRVHVGTEIPFVQGANERPEPVVRAAGSNLRLATLNVENLFTTLSGSCGPNELSCRGASTSEELELQLAKLTGAIAALDADVVALVEIENDADDSTLQALVNALNENQGSEVWDYVATGFVGTDAIKNGFIYRTESIATVGDFAVLDSSVDPDFDSSRQRPALAQTFIADDFYQFTAVALHLRAKSCSGASGANSDAGDGQGCWNEWRTLSSQALARWLDSNPTSADSDHTIVLGDFNAYAQEDPLAALYTNGYVNAAIAANFDNPEVYSYVFQGQSGSLDHAVVNSSMAQNMVDARAWHINSDELPVFNYTLGNLPSSSIPKPANFTGTAPFRSSDHDPIVVDFFFETPAPVDPETALPRGVNLPSNATVERFTVPGSENTSIEVRYEMGERLVDANLLVSPNNRVLELQVTSAVHDYQVHFAAAAEAITLAEDGMWEVKVGNHTLHVLAGNEMPLALTTASETETTSVYANEQAEIEFTADYQAQVITDDGYEQLRAVVTTNAGLANFFSVIEGSLTLISSADAGVSAESAITGAFAITKGEQNLLLDSMGNLTLDGEAQTSGVSYLWAGTELQLIDAVIEGNALSIATADGELINVDLGPQPIQDTQPTSNNMDGITASGWQTDLFGAVYSATVNNLELEVLANGALFIEQWLDDVASMFSSSVAGVTANVVPAELVIPLANDDFVARFTASNDVLNFALDANGFIELTAEGAEVAVHSAGSQVGFTDTEHGVVEYAAGDVDVHFSVMPQQVHSTRTNFSGETLMVNAEGFLATGALMATEDGYEQQIAVQNEEGLSARVIMLNSEIIARFEQCTESCTTLGDVLPSSVTIPADASIHLHDENGVNARIRMRVSNPIVFE